MTFRCLNFTIRVVTPLINLKHVEWCCFCREECVFTPDMIKITDNTTRTDQFKETYISDKRLWLSGSHLVSNYFMSSWLIKTLWWKCFYLFYTLRLSQISLCYYKLTKFSTDQTKQVSLRQDGMNPASNTVSDNYSICSFGSLHLICLSWQELIVSLHCLVNLRSVCVLPENLVQIASLAVTTMTRRASRTARRL